MGGVGVVKVCAPPPALVYRAAHPNHRAHSDRTDASTAPLLETASLRATRSGELRGQQLFGQSHGSSTAQIDGGTPGRTPPSWTHGQTASQPDGHADGHADSHADGHADGQNSWVTGLCWLYCRRGDVPVLWVGCVNTPGADGDLYACRQCLAELHHMVRSQDHRPRGAQSTRTQPHMRAGSRAVTAPGFAPPSGRYHSVRYPTGRWPYPPTRWARHALRSGMPPVSTPEASTTTDVPARSSSSRTGRPRRSAHRRTHGRTFARLWGRARTLLNALPSPRVPSPRASKKAV